jgi:PAS domain S-box-containing protein
MMPPQPLKILIVDDEPSHAEAIRRAFEGGRTEYGVRIASSLGGYREAVAESAPDLAIMDLNLPDGRAESVLTAPPEGGPFPIVVMTSHGDEATAVAAMKAGALDYIVKSPEAFAAMPQSAARALREWNLLMGRKEAEEAIRLGAERLRLALEAARAGTWEWDLRTGGQSWSEELWELYGVAPHSCEPSFEAWRQSVHPDDRERIDHLARMAARIGSELNLEWRVPEPDGSVRWIMSRGRPSLDQARRVVRFTGIAMDITAVKRREVERRELENRLRNSRRMEAAGLFAGEAAQEFSNLLTGIMGNIALAMMEHPGDEAAAALLEAGSAAERAGLLARRLMAFAARRPPEPVPVDVNEALASIQRPLARFTGPLVNLRIGPGTGPLTAMIDPAYLDQILFSIASEAVEMMPEGGELKISASLLTPGPGGAECPLKDASGNCILISAEFARRVSDGKAAKNITDVFYARDAFRGSASQAIAAALAAARRSGGLLETVREAGKLTGIRIILPKAGGAAAADETGVPQNPAGGGETVLIVEQDAIIREMTRNILARLGYRVLTSGDGAGAVETASGHDGVIDLLITGTAAGGMDGRELSSLVAARHPRLRTLFTPGSADDAREEQGANPRNSGFIFKPYSPQALAAKIRELLG